MHEIKLKIRQVQQVVYVEKMRDKMWEVWNHTGFTTPFTLPPYGLPRYKWSSRARLPEGV
jgi:hypothetical protein